MRDIGQIEIDLITHCPQVYLINITDPLGADQGADGVLAMAATRGDTAAQSAERRQLRLIKSWCCQSFTCSFLMSLSRRRPGVEKYLGGGAAIDMHSIIGFAVHFAEQLSLNQGITSEMDRQTGQVVFKCSKICPPANPNSYMCLLIGR